MPAGNKGSRFKNLNAKKLAEKWDLEECVWDTLISKNKKITIYDVQYIIDNINYESEGVSIFDKKNVPIEKRYFNNIPITKEELKLKYSKKYKKIWNILIIYKPKDNLLDDFFDIINENCSYY